MLPSLLSVFPGFERHGVNHECSLTDIRDSRYHFYLDVDVALDTYPASSLVQTLVLWMGVPVLTMCGELLQSQASANLLRHMSLDKDCGRW